MDITLATEGTYPHSYGGVSVWCDQLLRGMPEHRFGVTAIVGNGTEQVAWDLPANVQLTAVPLWGETPTAAPRRFSRGGRAGRKARRMVVRLHRRLLACLVADPADVAASDEFALLLRRLFEVSDGLDMPALLSGQDAIESLLEAWAAHAEEFAALGITPTVHDALTAVDLLEHALRPLFRPTPKTDITHAVTNGLAVLTGLAAKWTHGTPLIITEHGVYLRERYLEYGNTPYSWPVKTLLLNFLRRLCTTGYRHADLITPGNRYNQRWELRCGAQPDQLHTVYNGVDPTHFPPAGPEPATPTITWAGRIDPIKDLETLIRAFAIVRDHLPTARLRMFGGGDPDYRARCERLVVELGLDGAATFEGRIENILDAYAAGHLVALTSISEGFPYTLIEAMTAGRATVSTDVGGVTEAVAHTGLVVPPRDPNAFAAACLQLLQDDLLRHRLGASARHRALEYFTVEQAIDTFRAIYADVAAGRPVTAVAPPAVAPVAASVAAARHAAAPPVAAAVAAAPPASAPPAAELRSA